MRTNHRGMLATALLAVGLVMLSFSVSNAGDRGRPAEAAGPAEKFVVHEWGTFTNFSGSNGIQLEFRPLLDGELPPFVYDRTLQSFGSKGLLVARQRMETPVTYFYTERPREVEVRVDFPRGLLTEFYPPVRKMGPAYNGKPVKLQDSYLDWGRIRLLPQADFDALQITSDKGEVWKPALPQVHGDNHYAYARETDSAVVEFDSPFLHGKHYEKFLFYRGLGSFSLPLELKALGQGRFHVTNSGSEAVRSLFLVHVEQGRIFFTQSPLLAGGKTLSLRQSSVESTMQELGEAVVTALLETGLYEKEARSMVKTWQSSWFGEEGTRLFYVLPQTLTDEILPLTVSPPPDEVVRVLVGRMEVLTPEKADMIGKALADMGTCTSAHAEPLQSELARLGRFAEPALAWMQQSETDSIRHAQLGLSLNELQQERQGRALK